MHSITCLSNLRQMYSLLRSCQRITRRTISTTYVVHKKVSILGASGGIGQPLALLLKKNPIVQHLALYDVQHVKGVAADLSHIETKACVSAHQGQEELAECLKGSDVVVLATGSYRKPGMSRDDLFQANAASVANLVQQTGRISPQAMLCVVTSPLNSIVPVAAEILKRMNVFQPNRLFGVTTVDVVRANTFVAEAKGLEAHNVNVPVVGGHSGQTIIPIISKCVPEISFPMDERYEITRHIQNAGTEIVEIKGGVPTLSSLCMAYSVSRFVNSLLGAMTGQQGVIECAYVQSNVTDVEFFATPLLLGPNGIEENLGLPLLLEFEVNLLKAALNELQSNIRRGKKFGQEFPLNSS